MSACNFSTSFRRRHASKTTLINREAVMFSPSNNVSIFQRNLTLFQIIKTTPRALTRPLNTAAHNADQICLCLQVMQVNPVLISSRKLF